MPRARRSTALRGTTPQGRLQGLRSRRGLPAGTWRGARIPRSARTGEPLGVGGEGRRESRPKVAQRPEARRREAKMEYWKSGTRKAVAK